MVKASDPLGRAPGLRLVAEHTKKMFHLAPHALSMVIVVAHASHITEVFSHISTAQLVLAASMFAVWYFSHSGSEEI